MAVPKTPVVLQILRGNPGKRPINRNAPKPRRTPRLPDGMSDAAKRIWARILRDYAHTGVLTGVDTDVLRVYCEAVVRYETAATMLESTGPLVRGARNGGDLVKNPLHQVVRDNADLIRAYARELGFTPAARSALTDVPDAAEAGSLARWMHSGK